MHPMNLKNMESPRHIDKKAILMNLQKTFSGQFGLFFWAFPESWIPFLDSNTWLKFCNGIQDSLGNENSPKPKIFIPCKMEESQEDY